MTRRGKSRNWQKAHPALKCNFELLSQSRAKCLESSHQVRKSEFSLLKIFFIGCSVAGISTIQLIDGSTLDDQGDLPQQSGISYTPKEDQELSFPRFERIAFQGARINVLDGPKSGSSVAYLRREFF